MEWVVAALALGCLVFILHMLSDYYKRRQELEPKIRRLEEAKGKLQAEIQNSKGALDEQRGKLFPLREELNQMEREARQLQEQAPAKRPRQKGAANGAQAKDPP
jgi:predicted  nucleic acid-binding Zn-ribbon protein